MVEIVQSLSVCHWLVGFISLLHMNTCLHIIAFIAGWYFLSSFFTECPVGTFSESVSNSACQSCPANSEAAQPGLTKCPCVQTYYRAPDEGAGENCTRELTCESFLKLVEVCVMY